MITKLTRHDRHQTSVHLCKPGSTHYAALRCVKCNKHIQWLSQQDAEFLLANGVDYYNKG